MDMVLAMEADTSTPTALAVPIQTQMRDSSDLSKLTEDPMATAMVHMEVALALVSQLQGRFNQPFLFGKMLTGDSGLLGGALLGGLLF
jgi:hypothetical protein